MAAPETGPQAARAAAGKAVEGSEGAVPGTVRAEWVGPASSPAPQVLCSETEETPGCGDARGPARRVLAAVAALARSLAGWRRSERPPDWFTIYPSAEGAIAKTFCLNVVKNKLVLLSKVRGSHDAGPGFEIAGEHVQKATRPDAGRGAGQSAFQQAQETLRGDLLFSL